MITPLWTPARTAGRKNPCNNCSAPVIKKVVDYAFQGAFFLHELCYLAWNTTQKDCDHWFLHNMKQMCSIRGNWFTRSLCKGCAYIVYLAAVRGFGRSVLEEESFMMLRAGLKKIVQQEIPKSSLLNVHVTSV